MKKLDSFEYYLLYLKLNIHWAEYYVRQIKKWFHNNLTIITEKYLSYYLIRFFDFYYTGTYFLYSFYAVPFKNTYGSNLTYVSSLLTFIKFFKYGLVLFIIYTIFLSTNFSSYIKQFVEVSILSKINVLTQSEKELGSTDEKYLFAVLFLLTVSLFIFSSIFYFMFNVSLFSLLTLFLVYLIILIITVPLNLLIDFNLYFFAYIRGCASGNNFVKEFIFDLISISIMFIRFIIQNIRFLFIFLAVLELLEWSHTYGNNTFFFFNCPTITEVLKNQHTSLMVINLIMFAIYYFYYVLHLLFLLIVQLIAYVGILSWLFFFLYSVRFTEKLERSFMFYKKTV